MKRKLDTRFPAARIKKIMQTDEEVGKIAQATPVLVSKAVELFLQDLCRKTYLITADRGAKTVSEAHLVRDTADWPAYSLASASEGGGDEPDDHITDGNRQRSTLEEDSEEEDMCPRVTQGKEQSFEATNTKGRGRPSKIATKVSLERACGPPTLAVKKSSRSTKAPKGSLVASKRDADEVEGLEGGPPPIIKVEQESQILDICKRSPRSFDLNLDPKAEGEDFGHENSGSGEVSEPKDSTLPKSEVVGLGDLGGGEPICSHVELLTGLVTSLKPSVEEDDDYDCDD